MGDHDAEPFRDIIVSIDAPIMITPIAIKLSIICGPEDFILMARIPLIYPYDAANVMAINAGCERKNIAPIMAVANTTYRLA